MEHKSRAEFWGQFATAALSRQMTPAQAAVEADAMLLAFDRRWEWYEGYQCAYWRERKQKKASDGTS